MKLQRYLVLARNLRIDRFWSFGTIALSEEQALGDFSKFFSEKTGEQLSDEYEYQILPEDETLEDEIARLSFLMSWSGNGSGDSWSFSEIDKVSVVEEIDKISKFLAMVDANSAEIIAAKLLKSIPDDALLN